MVLISDMEHEVILSKFITMKFDYEITAWLSNNIIDNDHDFHLVGESYRKSMFIFYFRYECDAMAFKLRWI